MRVRCAGGAGHGGGITEAGQGNQGTAMPSAEEKFAEDVLSCVEGLNAVLPAFASRYDELVLVAALAEHVGGALRIFMRAGMCSSDQARRVLRHMEETAFATLSEVKPATASRVQ